MRFRLLTLMVIVAIGPPALAAAWSVWSAIASGKFEAISASVACGVVLFLTGGAAICWAFKGFTGRSPVTRFIAGSAITFVPLVAVLNYFAPELDLRGKNSDNLMFLMVISVAGLVGFLAVVRGSGSRQRRTV